MEKELRKKVEDKMQGAIAVLKKDFGAIRTGRASLAILDGLQVEYYGTPTPLQQVASLSVPESTAIIIQPWEQKIIGDIERAIQKSDMGLTPSNDGKVIRINIPPLTEERRKELVKVVKKRAEEGKIAIRNIRRDGNEQLKSFQKNKDMSEDELKTSLDEVQKITDTYVNKVDEVLLHKEKEIMEV